MTQIARTDILSPVAGRLIAALNAELTGRYPEEGACHFRLDPEEVAEGKGAFLVASADGVAVGCGAVRRISETEAEIKRMYVSPSVRGKGVGRALLSALEEEARRLGTKRLLLETGVRQPEALALYRKSGFAEIAPFGDYASTPLSVCMGKNL